MEGAASWYEADIERVLVTEEQIRTRTAELAAQVAEDYRGAGELWLVCVLKGAAVFTADFARELARHNLPVKVEYMQASSYGERTTSSGVVRLRKDLDQDVVGAHVLVVEDIVDSGLTLSWLMRYLSGRGAASVEVVSLFRKPKAVRSAPPIKYVGFDLPDEFVVGYGMDFAERYREIPFVGVLRADASTGSAG